MSPADAHEPDLAAAASRARGMWMDGWAPLGYDVQDRKLVVNEAEAEIVRTIFTRFLRIGLLRQRTCTQVCPPA